jgi:acyl homoserine lactone synthase
MIEAFSLATAHLFHDALASQARLRFRAFVEHRQLPHLHFDGMEYDEFDTPAAVYLVWRDTNSIVRGLIRLLPTTRPYMLQIYWPHLVTRLALPSSPDIWEVTRVCIDKSFCPKTRLKILPELLCGVEEYFGLFGVAAMVGVARPHLLQHFIKSGFEWLGEPDVVEGEIERAFLVQRQYIRPAQHCAKYDIPNKVLQFPGNTETKAAA